METQQPVRSYSRLATAGGFMSVLVWSTTVPVVRSISEQVGAVTGSAAVFALAGLVSLIYLFSSRERVREVRSLTPRFILACGVPFVLYCVAMFAAMNLAASRQQVLEVGLIHYLWPVLTVLLSLVLLPFRATILFVPATVLALAGIILVLAQDGSVTLATMVHNLAQNPVAYILAFTAALSWALYSNLARRLGGAGKNGGVEVFLAVTGLVMVVIRLALGGGSDWTLRAVIETVFMGVLIGVSYNVWDIAIRKGNAVLVTSIAYLTPLFSTLLSCAYLGVEAGFRLWIGCGLIVAGSALTCRSVSEKRVQQEDPQ